MIGSGPSLNGVDVSLLADVDSIAFNRSYVAWKRWGFAPTYFVCLDPIAFQDNVPEIQKLIEECPDTRFFLPESPKLARARSLAQVSPVRLVCGHTFSKDIFALTDFGNVGATSIQILALLGYRRIAMIGVDARYGRIDENMAVSDSDGCALVADDPDHFCAEYAKGKRLRVRPDLEKILGQWPQVAKECASNGIEVRNASSGSALDCFPLTSFASAIEWVREG